MAQSQNWKHGKYVPMVQFLCGGVLAWANPSKPNLYRCTKCGQEHSK